MFVVLLGLADVGLQSLQHLFLPSVARALAQVGLLAFIPSPLSSDLCRLFHTPHGLQLRTCGSGIFDIVLPLNDLSYCNAPYLMSPTLL